MMKTKPIFCQSQRKKHFGAIILFAFILLVLILSSCQIQPRYHQRGWQISLRNPGQSLHKLETANKQKNQAAFKTTQRPKHRLVDTTETDTQAHLSVDTASLPQMHIPQSLIAEGKETKWAYPKLINKDVANQISTFTIVGESFRFTGKLVGANENGLFLHNAHPPLFWIYNWDYGKGQTAIRNNVLYMPYTQINKIRKGGTVSSRIERTIESLKEIIFYGATAIFGIFIGIISVNSWNFNSFESIVGVAMILGAIAALIILGTLSLILIPLIFLIQLPFCRMKGRFWRINKSAANGKSFFDFINKQHARYRLYRSDLITKENKGVIVPESENNP